VFPHLLTIVGALRRVRFGGGLSKAARVLGMDQRMGIKKPQGVETVRLNTKVVQP